MFHRSLIFGRQPTDLLNELRGIHVWRDDFTVVAPTQYALASNSTSTPVFSVADVAGGWLQIASAVNTDNFGVYASTGKVVTFAAGKACYFGCKVKLTEANTDDANIIWGLSSVVTTSALTNDGAGPASSYDGAVFFKVDGTLKWQTETSHTTTQQTTAAAADYASATEYELGIFWDGVSAVHFYVNGVEVATHTTAGALPTAAMSPIFGVKNGGANVETVLFDWVVLESEKAAAGAGGVGSGTGNAVGQGNDT